MTLFEYLTIASSIILAMGMVRLVSGLFAALTSGPFWIHLLWLIVNIISHALYWWSLWLGHEEVSWNFPRFLYILLGPILLYAQAVALVPSNPDQVASWREHFFQVCRAFYVVRVLYLLHVAGLGSVLVGIPLSTLPLPAQVVLSLSVVLSVIGASTKDLRVQGALAILSAGTLLLAVVGPAFDPVQR